MSLRTTMVVAQLMLLLVAALVVYVLVRSIVLSGFEDLEFVQAQADVRRAESFLRGRADRLAAMAGDYALWDDTFEYFSGGNTQEYKEENLTTEVMSNLDLNVFALVDLQGEVVGSIAYDADAEEEIPLPDEFTQYFKEHVHEIEATIADGTRDGLIPMDPHPLLAGCRPATRTDGTGPSPGIVVFGRYLNSL